MRERVLWGFLTVVLSAGMPMMLGGCPGSGDCELVIDDECIDDLFSDDDDEDFLDDLDDLFDDDDD